MAPFPYQKLDDTLTPSSPSSVRSDSAATLTKDKQVFVDELRSFLQNCLMKDYFVTNSVMKWKYHDLKVKREPRPVHFSTSRHVWRDLAYHVRCPHNSRTFYRACIYPYTKTCKDMELDLLKYINQPAKILGLDAKRIQRRLVFYNPEREETPRVYNSMLKRLALAGEWQELVEKVSYDMSVIDRLFQNKTVKNAMTKQQEDLQLIMRKAVKEVQDTWFTSCGMQEGKLRFSIGPIPAELYQLRPRQMALARRREENAFLREMEKLRQALQERQAEMGAYA